MLCARSHRLCPQWKKVMAETEMKKAGLGSLEGGDYDGPLDVQIGSPLGRNGNSPWYLFFLKHQLSSGAFKVFKKLLKTVRPVGHTTGWAFSFSGDRWLSIDNTGVPNSLKLRDFLRDDDVREMLKDVSAPTHPPCCLPARDAAIMYVMKYIHKHGAPSSFLTMQGNVIKTITFRESLHGPKISVADAMKNSDSWVQTDDDTSLEDQLMDIPSMEDAGSSSASAGTSTASTPVAQSKKRKAA